MSLYKNKIEGEFYYGKHLLFDCSGCSREVTSIPFMTALLIQLAEIIEMETFGPAQVYRFGEGNDTGLSGVQLITTSLISFHTNDLTADLYLDVFSCKWFDEEIVAAFIEEKLSPRNINSTVILRK